MDLCAFDKLFSKNVPHILEVIFLSLDYKSYKKCYKVSRTWNDLLTSERYLYIGKLVFQDEISEDQRKLYNAAEAGDAIKVRTLLQCRMLDVNWRNRYSLRTPLHIAALYGHKAVVQLLLNRGADPNGKGENGLTPLHKAAKCQSGKCLKEVVLLLLEKGAEVNKPDNDGWTPLHYTVFTGCIEVVKLLLEKGAMVNARAKDGTTPLHNATYYGQKEFLLFLIEKGAEVNEPDNNGWTPLHQAALDGRKKIVELLLEKGAMVNARTKYGETPVCIAKEQDHIDIANIIMQK